MKNYFRNISFYSKGFPNNYYDRGLVRRFRYVIWIEYTKNKLL